MIAGFPPGKVNGAVHDKDPVAATAQEDRATAYQTVEALDGGPFDYGKADLVVMLHLVRTIERIASLVQDRYHDGLIRHLELAQASAEQGLTLGPEREVLVEAVAEATERIREFGNDDRVPMVPDIIQSV